jgi:dolichol-phosphate mannosyltransferase
MNELSIIAPVFNEEKNIREFTSRVINTVSKITENYEIIFCIDPCTDNTLENIKNEQKNNKKIKYLLFSRRFGQPAATMAGIFNSNAKYCVIIDVDLQDPPELIFDLYNKALKGFEVVYAKRNSRKGETFLKKIIAHTGYYLINKLTDISLPRNTGDFRIISKKIIEHLKQLKESHAFLRGLVSFVGFNQTFILYERDERFSGTGKYNRFFGSIRIALNALISFSSKPLFMMSIAGFFLSLLSFLIGLYYLFQKILGFELSAGLPTTVLLITFFSGIQLLSLGLLGEYVGRIYDEVKNRPLYIIDEKKNFDD